MHLKTRRRTVGVAAAAAMVAALALPPWQSAQAGVGRVSVGGLTTEHLADPLGIDTAEPRLSWITEANYNGAKQRAYEIRVSTKDNNSGDMWSTGKVKSADSFDVEYAGKPLQPRTRYYWSVRVWTESSSGPSAWSDRASFETAFLEPSQFGGRWIGRESTAAATATPEVLLRKEFTLANKEITSARAYVAGLGYHELYLNGTRVGDHELDPGSTVYDKTILYVTHDVTSLLRRGKANAIGVSLGHGYYTGYPVLKLQLDVTYKNGATERIVTDGTWSTEDGPTTANSVMRGETYDARLEQPGWNDTGFDAAGWDAALIRTAPAGQLEAQDMEPIRVTGTLPTPVLREHDSGAQIYDFETTRAGWATVQFQGPAGATVTMKYGEKLLADGTVNNNSTLQAYTYVLKGGGVETFTPSYSYNGYRYLQVNAPEGVTVRSVVGKTVNNDVASTGGFTSSNELFNRYHKAMRQSIVSNLHSFPTDTPMYEKAGWTADGHLFADSTLLNFDSESFWAKWMGDHADSLNTSGQLPVTLPGTRTPTDDPVWTSSYILVNYELYQSRGETRILSEHYDGMKLWVDHLEDVIAATGYLYTGGTYGDHEPAAGGPDNPDNAEFPRTADNRAIGTAHIYLTAVQMAEIARVLGKTSDAAGFDALAGTIKQAYNAALYNPTEKLYSANPPEYRQTDNLVPLAFGLAPEADRAAICANLADDVHVEWQDHLDTGAVGTKYIMPILTQCGQQELAFKVATNPTYPGWGWWFQTLDGLDVGPETLIVDTMWEAWCWFPSTDCVTDSSRSHNHAFRGTIDDWLYEYVAGIRSTAPGYRQIQIQPYPVGDLTDASAYVTSPLGTVSSSWTRTAKAFTLKVEVPVGATAEVLVPVGAGQSVSGSGGAKLKKVKDGYATFTVGSGDYTFKATSKK
ncbi:family 78 glycoside hydrolase catalytic domain [Phytohabitans sp. ZYX-F-186]|uniref:alpha-L-rhamnosidase n=1 Tax=Phytohabitans maris TaxID=3071409 RepID=A0ABU0ZPR2_9ACTN|nr:family 78 glycoside hydrolase catalytic domain [Phytohabitans sp. ZYX-F-186]MDQ7909030.1 family 78 glycoside hydrolase catalytic domain [Phytohabitans sp. ZYX-F-186]